MFVTTLYHIKSLIQMPYDINRGQTLQIPDITFNGQTQVSIITAIL